MARAWIKALNADDNEAAADLFADDARVMLRGGSGVLHSHSDALRFAQALPCSARIISVSTDDDVAVATVELGDRLVTRCGGFGETSRTAFQVRDGRIVVWRDLGPPPPPPPAPTT